MSSLAREVRPSQKPGHVINEHAMLEAVPAHWSLLPPGDAALSRRIKQDGPSWTMVEVVGRKRFSRGIWAPTVRIEALLAERRDPAYQRQLDAGRIRRARVESEYTVTFRAAVLSFLAFHPRYAADATRLAALIAEHATPVGSGTVARTQRIPVEARAEAATIAWLRHQTTGYDTMHIPLIKGKRREVRRQLAQRSHQLLAGYRQGRDLATSCPLQTALRRADPAPVATTATAVQGTLF